MSQISNKEVGNNWKDNNQDFIRNSIKLEGHKIKTSKDYKVYI